MQPSIDDAETLVAQGRAGVSFALATTCQNDVALEDALLAFDRIDGIFNAVQGLIACPPNQDQLLKVLNDGMCGDTYKGLWVIWLCMFVCAGGLFAVTVSAACAYPNFPSKRGAGEAATVMAPASSAPPVENEVRFSLNIVLFVTHSFHLLSPLAFFRCTCRPARAPTTLLTTASTAITPSPLSWAAASTASPTARSKASGLCGGAETLNPR